MGGQNNISQIELIKKNGFECGDIVRATKNCSGSREGREYVVGKKGYLREPGNPLGSDCGCSESWIFLSRVQKNCTIPEYIFQKLNQEELTEIKSIKKTFMQKVSIMMKKLLDSDTQELVKAGFLNGDLMPTEEGGVELDAILFIANKAALVERAKEINAEAEKNS